LATILDDLHTLVRNDVQDSGYTTTTITTFLNRGVQEVAGRVALPSLLTSDTVRTPQATITGATQADPCVITAVAHGLLSYDIVLITGVVGMTELNNKTFTITKVDADSFNLNSINASAYTAYTSGGTAYAANVAMPATAGNVYHNRRDSLVKCYSYNLDRQIPIWRSWARFLNYRPALDDEGTIERVCVRDTNLFFQGIPATQDTLMLHFYRKPVDMADATSSTDTPDGIPDHLQEPLLVNFAAREIFREEGQAELAADRDLKYQQAMAELRLFYGPEDKNPTFIHDDGDYTGRGIPEFDYN
jgi:hypothetical protein